MLKQKLNELDTKVEYITREVPFLIYKYISNYLNNENVENHFEDDIFSIDHGKRELAHVNIYGKMWFVCYKWIPLWKLPYDWRCMEEKSMDGCEYFSIPDEDYECELQKNGRLALEKIGFETASSDGFWIPNEIKDQCIQSNSTTENHIPPWIEDFYCKICKSSDEKTNSIWKKMGYCKECFDSYYPNIEKLHPPKMNVSKGENIWYKIFFDRIISRK